MAKGRACATLVIPLVVAQLQLLRWHPGRIHVAENWEALIKLHREPHRQRRRDEITQSPSNFCAVMAEPKVRAGFKLIPESGVSIAR